MAAVGIVQTRILEELRRYIFNEIPIYLIDLQSEQRCDRQAVLERFHPIFSALTTDDLPEGLEASLLNAFPSSTDRARIRNFIRERVRYAILSHHWGDSEPVFGQVPNLPSSEGRPGHYKVAKFCDIARSDHDAEFGWVDSCCIDKSIDAELNRSIRSMYRWYANSCVCIVHLAETMSLEDLSDDIWFRRGWTLLELLAPERLKFYSATWNTLTNDHNDKQSPAILAGIETATSISPQDLQQFDPSSRDTYQISKRMRWAANRSTTLAEDRAYSLMGVFGVVIDVAYGEGAQCAFSRLFQEIVHFSNSPEVVNWIGNPATALSLRSLGYPSIPDCFIGSSDIGGLIREEPISLAANGLAIKLLVLPATLVTWETARTALLRCFGVQVGVDCLPEFIPDQVGEGSKLEFALGAWNFSTLDGRCRRAGNLIEAVLLHRIAHRDSHKDGWSRIPTRSFIRFALKVINLPRGKRWEDYMQTVVL